MIVNWTVGLTMIVALARATGPNNMLEEPTTESSAEYLRKAMIELRDLNLPPPIRQPNRHAGSSFHFDLLNDKDYLVGKRHSGGKRLVQQVPNVLNSALKSPIFVPTMTKNVGPLGQDLEAAESAPSSILYYKGVGGVGAQKVTPEMYSTKGQQQFATIHKESLEKGNTVHLNALVDALRQEQLASAATSHRLETNKPQPMYAYYFYPLKNLMNEVYQANHLHYPQMHLQPESTELTENSQKDMSNPLFIAISGFIGMAVLFMIGVLILPRLADFRSRFATEDKFLHLTKTIGEAIDRHNCSEDMRYKSFNENIDSPCQPIILPKPSSVVLLTRKSALRKEAAKRRKKLGKKCKTSPCRKTLQRPA